MKAKDVIPSSQWFTAMCEVFMVVIVLCLLLLWIVPARVDKINGSECITSGTARDQMEIIEVRHEKLTIN